MIKRLKFKTGPNTDIIDITDEIERVVSSAYKGDGICLITASHTTCAIISGEYEPEIAHDFKEFIEHLKPEGPFKHAHTANHAPSHLLSNLFGTSRSFPLESGNLLLGTWQRILLIEFDGPREREVVATIIQNAGTN